VREASGLERALKDSADLRSTSQGPNPEQTGSLRYFSSRYFAASSALLRGVSLELSKNP
jgi:hypothetical protein